MVADGAMVIDVGINRVDDPATDRGYRQVGDIDFDEVEPGDVIEAFTTREVRREVI